MMLHKNNKVALASLGALILGGGTLPATSGNLNFSLDLLHLSRGGGNHPITRIKAY
ncbi:hypothetical protein [Candidatus Mycoplasma haematominutum]|uniref:Uncharacterized protein n=1 Tax=Candidatus Mycoplasma haematominutum 'Birmingham 1' TaxID=1116213 RepID=G8C3H6_9MOLU|nr:hypothetical protein [Candidatus Mycoplasma haematominutum]CCE66874.1 hypothetical protein MHM_03560 [Candidatus Mycoplasma haematominutum 'Birmingham 1']